MEYALGLLPTKPAVVQTPTKAIYNGMHVNASVCGVSVIRSGEAMETALRSCWKGIDIGKILVQRWHHVPVSSSTSQMDCLDRLTCDGDAETPVNGSRSTKESVMYEDAHGTYYQQCRCVTSYLRMDHDSRVANSIDCCFLNGLLESEVCHSCVLKLSAFVPTQQKICFLN